MTLTPPLIQRRTGLLLLALWMPLAPLRADEQAPAAPRELLRDALYAEEVTRDATKAAAHYEKVLELYEAQQPFAATALFRLAEVRRKQGNKEEAAKLYQRLIREFPAAEVEGKLARENLAAMGNPAATVPDADSPASDDEESKELRRLQELARSSPDLARDPKLLTTAASKGQTRVIAFLIDSGLDPREQPALEYAARSGNLKAVELLIAKGCDPAKSPHDQALVEAVKMKFRSIVEVLLKSGADANRTRKFTDRETGRESSTMSPLHYAAARNDEAMCRLLIEHGADLNFMPELCYRDAGGSRSGDEKPVGTPLHQALASEYAATTNLPAMLIKAGAKPGLPAAVTGITPLHLAAAGSNLPMLRLLLEAGVPVNAQVNPLPPVSNGQGQNRPTSLYSGGLTALDLAVEHGSREAIDLLLDKGADPNLATDYGVNALGYALSKSRDLISLLLQRGAKPDSPQLLIESLGGDLEIVKQFLDAGADPNKISTRYGKNAIQWAIDQGNSSAEVVQLLLDHGAEVDKGLLSAVRNSSPEVRRLLWERFILPDLLERPAITLTNRENSGSTWTPAKREGEGDPPQLEALLLDTPSLPYYYIGNSSIAYLPEVITIHRREKDGSIKKLPARIDGSAPMPKLEWGDVVDLALDPSIKNYRAIEPRMTSDKAEMSPETYWKLHQHLVVPISLHLDPTGPARPFTLRGDRLVYHPGEAVAPIAPVGVLSKLIWSRVQPLALSIRRAGWPEIRIEKGSAQADTFLFQAGDEVTPVYPGGGLAELENKARDGVATLTVPGTTFAKTWPANHPPTAPSLMEVIADLYASWPGSVLGKLPEESSAARWGIIAARQQGERVTVPLWYNGNSGDTLAIPAIPEHPDFSKIRIHRRAADGKESILEIDLTKAFAATTAATTREEAARHDVMLQAGDLIELPLLQGGAPWKGFNEAQALFIGKLLNGVFQYTDGNGTLRRKTLLWQPVQWFDSAGGSVPMPPEQGVSSTLARHQDFLGGDSNPEVSRGSSSELYHLSADFFIRDGDRMVTGNITEAPQPNLQQQLPNAPQVPQPRPPRPRVRQ
ncbi:ankyrin repeat domain-containing protein [Haloferula sp. BvORR071]|uniref:ankyrin repeat domain-containing protein n=1 Tax=Haloferula sp. BvORR071 TaxID=1396141 RepID=UPI0005551187|nr:ankyrin repeat domain-containing protein [Haloferula sp. BvORR071]